MPQKVDFYIAKHHIHGSKYKSHAGVTHHNGFHYDQFKNAFADGRKQVNHKEPAFAVGRGRRKHSAKFHSDLMQVISEEEAIISAYDTAGKGYLLMRELRALITTLSGPNEPVEAAEVNWIMFMADKDKDSRIGPEDVGAVKAALIAYLKARKRVQSVFDKYDISRDGVLQRNEVKNMLIDLNDGVSIGDEEVEWVLANTSKFRAGQLVKPEVEGAISFWYHNSFPAEPTINVKDRKKGGVVGRAVTQMIRQQTHEKFFPTDLK